MAKIKYTLLNRIDGGGVADLTLVLTDDGRQLVLRRLKRGHFWNQRMRRRFVRGAQIREVLSPHPHIVRGIETGSSCFMPYELIEYVPGRNLAQLIQEDYLFVQSNYVELMRQSAMGLARVHEKTVVHLDVKPENFLVDNTAGNLHVKLTDFDLSCFLGQKRDDRNPGTIAYIAPETFTKGTVNLQTDIYAFGVIAFYAATKHMPFTAATAEELLRQRTNQDEYFVVDPTQYNRNLSAGVCLFIQRCMHPNPAERYNSMYEVLDELKFF
jgi:serine/threonine-protein kinase